MSTTTAPAQPGMLIGGDTAAVSSGERFETLDPATGATLALEGETNPLSFPGPMKSVWVALD